MSTGQSDRPRINEKCCSLGFAFLWKMVQKYRPQNPNSFVVLYENEVLATTVGSVSRQLKRVIPCCSSVQVERNNNEFSVDRLPTNCASGQRVSCGGKPLFDGFLVSVFEPITQAKPPEDVQMAIDFDEERHITEILFLINLCRNVAAGSVSDVQKFWYRELYPESILHHIINSIRN